MKKLVVFFVALSFFIQTTFAFADTLDLDISTPKINNQDAGVSIDQSVGSVLGNALTIIYIVAALAVLFMLVLGAFQWITSGGDKESLAKARGRITQALVGLVILALAFFIVVVVGRIVNIDILNLPSLPTLNGSGTAAVSEECRTRGIGC